MILPWVNIAFWISELWWFAWQSLSFFWYNNRWTGLFPLQQVQSILSIPLTIGLKPLNRLGVKQAFSKNIYLLSVNHFFGNIKSEEMCRKNNKPENKFKKKILETETAYCKYIFWASNAFPLAKTCKIQPAFSYIFKWFWAYITATAGWRKPLCRIWITKKTYLPT